MDLENLLLDWLEPSQVASSKNRFPTRASEDDPVCFCCFEIGSHYVASDQSDLKLAIFLWLLLGL